jgi:hypothetical protein
MHWRSAPTVGAPAQNFSHFGDSGIEIELPDVVEDEPFTTGFLGQMTGLPRMQLARGPSSRNGEMHYRQIRASG